MAESPNQYDIIDTNISLLNGDNSLNQTIAFNVTSPYEWDSFNVGKIRYSSFRVQVDVADNMTQVGSRESALFTVDNRESPSIYVTDTTANEDFGTYDLTINATDPETPTNELTYSWTNNNTALTTLTINNATGIATFTSIPNTAGSASINISVTNNYGLQNSTTFNFIVNQVNDNPQFDPISSFSLNEDFGEYKINLNTNITDVEPHGSFWLTDSNTNKIYNYEKLTGIALGNIDLAPVGITGVRDLAIDFKDQTLWVIDQGSGFVYHIGRDGTNLTGGFDIKTAGASNASGICYDVSDDSLWITDFLTNNFVYHFDKNGNNLTGFAASTGGVENAYGITFDSTDYSLWIGDPIGNFVYHFDRSGNNLTGGFAMNHPDGFGIEFDTTDNSFWVVDLNDKFIYHHNAVGDNTTGGIAITQTGIRGVALDATGLTFNWTVSNTTVLNLNIFNVTGIAHFTSVANQSGTADVSISVVDAGGLSNSTSFTITVNAINDAPWWSDVNNASASISENSQNNNVSLNVSWQDYWNDVEGSPPTNPSVTTNDTSITTCSFNSGDLICNALLNATGSIAVKITAEDDIAQTAILNFELGINFMNQQPWVDGTLPSVDIQENTGGFFAWLWDIIRNIFRDVDQDQEPTSVEIISQSNSSVADCITIGVYYDNFDGENDTGAVLNPTLWNISENPSTSFLGNGQLHIDGQLNVLLTSIASKTSFKNVNFTIGNVEISAQGTGNNVGIYLSTTEGYQALIDGSNYPLPDVIPLMYLTGNESIPTNISVYWTSGTGLEVYLNDTLVSTYSDLTNTSYYIKFDSSAGGNPSNYSIDYVSGSGGNVTISCTTQPNATGINIVTVNYTNAGGLSVTTTGEVNVTGVNDAPWFDPIANTSVIQENQLSLNVSLQVPWQDSWHDVEDAYPSSSYLKTNNTDLSCALTSGDIVCSALNNASGAATISIEANDSEGGSAWVSFDLLMNHTNQQPWIDQIANVSVDEDVGLTVITTGVLLNWSFRDVEDDQNPANTTVFAQSNETVAVCFIDAITGGLSCNTGANQSGETTITLQFDDSEGLSVSEGITVFVTPINDAPNVDWTGLTPDGGNYSTGQPFYFNVTDVEDEVVNNCTIYRGGLYSNSTTTTVLGVSTNFIQYAMNASEAGIYSFTMECVDSVGSISNPTTAKVVAFDNILPSTAFTSPASDNSTTLFFTTPAGSVTLTLNISIYDIILNSTNITIWKADGTQVYNNYTSEWQSALFENKDDVTITQGNGTYYLEVKSLDYANNDPPELIQFDVLDGSDVQSLSTSIQTTQLPTKTYYYEANLTWNDNQYSDANIELNISNVTYTLTKSDDNTSYARFSSSIYTPLSREGETSPYSFNINLTATNGTILSNNTAATGSITNGNVQFDICNDTLVDPAYLEFNFLDESNTTIQLSAALADGTYIDYTLDPARQEYRRMYYNTVGVTSGNYTFCTNQNETYYITDFMLYYATGYSQRTHQQPHTLTESIHNETLYLVSNTVGSYITFNTYNPAGSPISNVAVVSERQISGVWTTVETKYTDAAGVVLFLVDVTSPYRFTFTKTGYEDLVYTPSIPIQTATAYTIILQTTTGTTIESYSTGVSYDIKPKNATLTYNTTYNFSIDLTSEYFTTIDEVGIWLTNGTDNITSLVTCSGDVACSTSLLGYTGMNPQIKMYYYWRVNGTVSSPQFFKSWWVSQAYTGNGSLQNLVDDINAMTYRWDSESRERFSFTTALLSFFLVMIATGTLSYVSGIYSPAALLVFATGCFWMLAVIGLLPAMGGHWWLIPAMITIVTASYYAFETIRI